MEKLGCKLIISFTMNAPSFCEIIAQILFVAFNDLNFVS